MARLEVLSLDSRTVGSEAQEGCPLLKGNDILFACQNLSYLFTTYLLVERGSKQRILPVGRWIVVLYVKSPVEQDCI